jgi:hypothetical protein
VGEREVEWDGDCDSEGVSESVVEEDELFDGDEVGEGDTIAETVTSPVGMVGDAVVDIETERDMEGLSVAVARGVDDTESDCPTPGEYEVLAVLVDVLEGMLDSDATSLCDDDTHAVTVVDSDARSGDDDGERVESAVGKLAEGDGVDVPDVDSRPDTDAECVAVLDAE